MQCSPMLLISMTRQQLDKSLLQFGTRNVQSNVISFSMSSFMVKEGVNCESYAIHLKIQLARRSEQAETNDGFGEFNFPGYY